MVPVARIAALFGILTILSACVTETTTSEERVSPYPLSSAEISVVRDGVVKGLKDPNSAIHGDKYLATTGLKGIIYVCGYVNARNSFGGYVGSQPFMGAMTKDVTNPSLMAFSVLAIGGSEIDTIVTKKMCQRYGITI